MMEKDHSNMTRQRKGKRKGSQTIQQNDNTPERQGKVNSEKKIAFRVSTTKEDIVVTIESVSVGFPAMQRRQEIQM